MEEETKDIKKPIWQHVLELRACVIKSLFVLIITSSICYLFSEQIFSIIIRPLLLVFEKTNTPHRLIYTNLTEAFITYLKVSIYSGIFLSAPYILMQLWMFLLPALLDQEKKVLKYLFVAVPFYFLMGAFFAYYWVLPTAFSYFLSFETTIKSVPLQLETKMSDYVSLVMRMVLSFGITFQLPIILAVLSWCKIITSEMLIKKWRFAIVGVTFLSAIITPPDAISMILLAIPLLLLYSLSIFIVKKIETKNQSCTI